MLFTYIICKSTINLIKVDLSLILIDFFSFVYRKFSSPIIDLCLTYNMNLGLSTPSTSKALWNIHQVGISQFTS